MQIYPKEPKPFIPVELIFKFDTQDEINAFAALFNITRVSDAIRPHGVDASLVRRFLVAAGADSTLLHDKILEKILD